MHRFIQADTIVPNPNDPQTLNRFSYVNNNPVKYTDPTGHKPTCDEDNSCDKPYVQKCVGGSCKPVPPASVRYQYRWIARIGEGKQVELASNSSGTIIGNETMLTHGHQRGEFAEHPAFDGFGAGNESVTLGKQQFRNPRYGEYGDETTLVELLGGSLPAPATLASRDEIKNLQAGDEVDVVFWSDPNRELRVATLPVRGHISGGYLELEDTYGVINRGDSGGGVYYNGHLIGNLTSITPRTQSVYLALIPSQLQR